MRISLVVIALLLSIIYINPSFARASAKISLKNVKMQRKAKNVLNQDWFDYLGENEEILRKPGKEYKVDQKLVIQFNMNEENDINFDSLKITKDKKNNIPYNLKALEFLRKNADKLQVKKADKPVIAKFIYLSF